MNTVFFSGRDGSLSSVRVGSPSLKLTSYFSRPDGGATFYSGNSVSRINSKGQSIAFGLSSGQHTTYFGSNGSVSSRITPFI